MDTKLEFARLMAEIDVADVTAREVRDTKIPVSRKEERESEWARWNARYRVRDFFIEHLLGEYMIPSAWKHGDHYVDTHMHPDDRLFDHITTLRPKYKKGEPSLIRGGNLFLLQPYAQDEEIVRWHQSIMTFRATGYGDNNPYARFEPLFVYYVPDASWHLPGYTKLFLAGTPALFKPHVIPEGTQVQLHPEQAEKIAWKAKMAAIKQEDKEMRERWRREGFKLKEEEDNELR